MIHKNIWTGMSPILIDINVMRILTYFNIMYYSIVIRICKLHTHLITIKIAHLLFRYNNILCARLMKHINNYIITRYLYLLLEIISQKDFLLSYSYELWAIVANQREPTMLLLRAAFYPFYGTFLLSFCLLSAQSSLLPCSWLVHM